MERIVRIVMADDNSDFCQSVREAIKAESDLECVGCVHDGFQALEAVRRLKPDLLILDHVMPKLDGLGVLERIRTMSYRPKIIMLTAFGEESFIQKASELGADYYIMKPFDLETLIERMRQVVDPRRAKARFQYERRRQWIERQATQALSSLGVPPHFKGYTYLKDAITLVVLEPELLGAVTKELYPWVARMRQTSAEKVERAIRHAIESTWTRGNLEYIDQLFAYTVDADKGKPTNSSFIARLADHIRMDLIAS